MAERKAAVLKVFDMFFALRSGLEKRKKRIMELVEGNFNQNGDLYYTTHQMYIWSNLFQTRVESLGIELFKCSGDNISDVF